MSEARQRGDNRVEHNSANSTIDGDATEDAGRRRTEADEQSPDPLPPNKTNRAYYARKTVADGVADNEARRQTGDVPMGCGVMRCDDRCSMTRNIFYDKIRTRSGLLKF